MNIRGRIGRFFFFIGLFILMFFMASFLIKEPRYLILPVGLLSTLLGLVLILGGRKPATPSGRFRAIRTVQQKLAERGSKRDEQSEKR